MSAKYTVIQYLPDPTADERINVGVLTWDEGGIRARFIDNWRRVQAFSGGDINVVKKFVRKLSELTDDQKTLQLDGDKPVFDRNRLEKMIGTWCHNIQFSEPRGSLKDSRELLQQIAPVFLHAVPRQKKVGRTRRTAASLAHRFVFKCVKDELPDEAEDLVHTNKKVNGLYDSHKVDVVLQNGKLIGAVHALSFEINEGDHLSRELDSTAWAIDDLRKKYRRLPIAVYALPPNDRRGATYSKAARVFKGLNAELVTTEHKLESWTRGLITPHKSTSSHRASNRAKGKLVTA